MTREKAINLILAELGKSEKEYPDWPGNKIHAAAIPREKSGKLVMAAIGYEYGLSRWGKIKLKFFGIDKRDKKEMEIEAARCGATAIRILINL